MNIKDHWQEIREEFQNNIKKSSYCAFATVDKAGNPHITPIGSLILAEACQGFFFERFPEKMPKNFQTSDRVAVMTVNTGFFYWFRALRKGVFHSPPGLRLYGRVGELRPATESELFIWQKKIRRAKGSRGYDILWKDMTRVRDIYFDDVRLVTAGAMTRSLWK
ncbi:MAG: pyridoxamine 5'-phosphate oxidase family protein [Desulfobacter sp.]|nr:pyridoxamine 5'-phosphate oxidase family protein [Desulfobacter sp.]WDP84273.1 MAG: pyridoxamine 5'-phosphate oxidase family protein [Desulfobacter sp.]